MADYIEGRRAYDPARRGVHFQMTNGEHIVHAVVTDEALQARFQSGGDADTSLAAFDANTAAVAALATGKLERMEFDPDGMITVRGADLTA